MTWRDMLTWIWHILGFPLFELEGYPISLGKLISGLLLLGLGWAVSRRAARIVDQRLLVRLNLDESMRYTFRRLIYYFFLFLSTLFTLRTLHVPLTAFTVIGGALAVGVGFGSQNLVNNFISGLLVMVERPIRVNDFIEIDGIACRVQSIGIRSTYVRTLANALVAIPNTAFIEKNLWNWTQSGAFAAAVRFGVAYGTDTRRLKEICLDLVRSVPGVSPTPEPWLTFVDFGDNALIFDLGFFLDSAFYPSRGGIQSEIRYRLYDAFNQHGIQMPFPQREVHVNLPEELPVRLRN